MRELGGEETETHRDREQEWWSEVIFTHRKEHTIQSNNVTNLLVLIECSCTVEHPPGLSNCSHVPSRNILIKCNTIRGLLCCKI